MELKRQVVWSGVAVGALVAAFGCSDEPELFERGDGGASSVAGAGGQGVGATGGTSIMVPTNLGGVGGQPLNPFDPDSYELPEGFTTADSGGWLLGDKVVDDKVTIKPEVADGCGNTAVGIVRDFRHKKATDGHPDFQVFFGKTATTGMVETQLGPERKPVRIDNGQTTSDEAFDQWYRDVPDVNQSFLIYFSLEPKDGVVTFASSFFFPLDGAGFGEAGFKDKNGEVRNFHFTTELHTAFKYKGGETFTFTGDDDLWVFINGKLAIDLGGLHPALTQTIEIDELGLTKGKTYPLELFHAERSNDESNFRIDTTLEFTNCGVDVGDFVR